MLKKFTIVLMVAVSLCMAENAMFAYSPFPIDGLSDEMKSDGYGKYAYAPATVYYNGAFHQFYCSSGQQSDNFFNPDRKDPVYDSFDHIRYRVSKNGVDWSAPRVVMTVNSVGDEECACDPSVVNGGDGYWYMLYDGSISKTLPKYGAVVYLARSKYIQGPYFKYLGNDVWEDEPRNYGKPKMMLGVPSEVYGTGQQTIVKRDDGFHVWYRSKTWADEKSGRHDDHLRYIHVENLKDLSYEESKYVCVSDIVKENSEGAGEAAKDEKVSECDGETTKDNAVETFNGYDLVDVRYNETSRRWNMWLVHGYLEKYMEIKKFVADENNPTKWTLLKNKSVIGPYNYIHNIGVSGDEHGSIWNDTYLVSFAGPDPERAEDPQKALFLDEDELDKVGYNIVCHRSGVGCPEKNGKKITDLKGYWPMWQEYVGTTLKPQKIYYPKDGFIFPKNVSGTDVDYFTGDYDGDGISDLGAVDRLTGKWYIYSTFKGSYINWNEDFVKEGHGDVLVPNMNSNFEIISGDYDGDGKTDLGTVDKVNGLWYIISSKDKSLGVGKSMSDPNYIPWGWNWGGVTSAFKILVGDFSGDGIADRAVYKAPNWYIIPSEAAESAVCDGVVDAYGKFIRWGWNWEYMADSHVAVPGDFDGDGITDRAIYGLDNGYWYARASRKKDKEETAIEWHWRSESVAHALWDLRIEDDYEGTIPVAGDYDGDGVDDLVQVNLSDGRWSTYRSVDGKYYFSDGQRRPRGDVFYGEPVWERLANAKQPVILVGDFDGDGRADRAFADKETHKFYVISSKNRTEGVERETMLISMGTLGRINELTPRNRVLPGGTENENTTVVQSVPVGTLPVNISAAGRNVSVTNVQNGDKIAVFNVLGKKVYSSVSNGNPVNFELPSYGKFVVRAGIVSKMIVVK